MFKTYWKTVLIFKTIKMFQTDGEFLYLDQQVAPTYNNVSVLFISYCSYLEEVTGWFY